MQILSYSCSFSFAYFYPNRSWLAECAFGGRDHTVACSSLLSRSWYNLEATLIAEAFDSVE